MFELVSHKKISYVSVKGSPEELWVLKVRLDFVPPKVLDDIPADGKGV